MNNLAPEVAQRRENLLGHVPGTGDIRHIAASTARTHEIAGEYGIRAFMTKISQAPAK
ncbi:hypothetical protein [Pseudarthrobacter sp. H2]|uniref:hypothetical protein n=1 Tax=Pseudarthrobacter sp. H2 TaxID=3418415 RepID=UPI003CF844A4